MAENKICLGCMEEKKDEKFCPRCGYQEGAPAASPLYLAPGTVLKGQYLVGRVLGCGGFGITYLARDLNLGTKLAVKEYFPSGMVTRGSTDPTVSVYSGEKNENFEYGLEKFIDEARTLAKFDDVAEIVSIKDFFKENGTAYLVMSYVDGVTLKQYLENQGGKLSPDAVLTFMLPVMKALEQVHQRGILHRDISPDNIFVTKSFDVKLLDFGAARFAMGEHSKSLSVLMKPGYTPEEQYRTHGNQGPWTDEYSVAATMYKLLTGKTPAEALDRMEKDELEPLSAFGVEVPASFQAALFRALSVRAEDRFQSMAEFEAALTAEVREEKHPVEPKTEQKPPVVAQPKAEPPKVSPVQSASQAPVQTAYGASAYTQPAYTPPSYQSPAYSGATPRKKSAAVPILAVLSAILLIVVITLGTQLSSSNDRYDSMKTDYNEQKSKAESQEEILSKVKQQIPLLISGVTFSNVDKSEKEIDSTSTSFSSARVQYIMVSFQADSLGDASTDDIMVKYIKPSGQIMQLSQGSPNGYTIAATHDSENKWHTAIGSDSGSGVFNNNTGTYTVQIWCQDKFLTQRSFTIN